MQQRTSRRARRTTLLAVFLAVAAGAAAVAQTPTEVGTDDFRISTMGPGGEEEDSSRGPVLQPPDIAIAPGATEGIVAWIGNDQGMDQAFVRRISLETGATSGAEVVMSPAGTVLVRNELAVACTPDLLDCYLAWIEERNVGGFDELVPVLRPFDGTTLTALAAPQAITDLTGIEPSIDLYPSGRRIYPNADQQEVTLAWQHRVFSTGGAERWVERRSFGWWRAPGSGLDDPTVWVRTFLPGGASRVEIEYLLIGASEDELLVWTEVTEQGSEVFAQIGPYGARLQVSNTTDDPGSNAVQPAVAYDPGSRRALIVWLATGNGATVPGELEVYGQFIEPVVASRGGSDWDFLEVGPDDFRISFVDGDGDRNRDADQPDVAFDPQSDRFVVTWAAEDTDFFLANEEFEIFLRAVDKAGNLEGTLPLRVSRMGGPNQLGGTGDSSWTALHPTIGISSGRAAVAWWGRNKIFGPGLADNWTEDEIWGQFVQIADEIFSDGFESGDTNAWN